MEAISSANDLFHQPKFSQVSPKLSLKMPSRKFGGLQFLIRQRKSFLPWQLSFVGSSYFANMITILFQLLFLSYSFGIEIANTFMHPRIPSKTIPEFRRQLAKSIRISGPKRSKTRTLGGGTYLWRKYKGVPPPPGGGGYCTSCCFKNKINTCECERQAPRCFLTLPFFLYSGLYEDIYLLF